MLDKKWIENNYDAFVKAQKSRARNANDAERIDLQCQILLLHIEMDKCDKQIEQLQNEIKKDDARLFLVLKKSGFDEEEIKSFLETLGK